MTTSPPVANAAPALRKSDQRLTRQNAQRTPVETSILFDGQGSGIPREVGGVYRRAHVLGSRCGIIADTASNRLLSSTLHRRIGDC
jgi:hypothetical protein